MRSQIARHRREHNHSAILIRVEDADSGSIDHVTLFHEVGTDNRVDVYEFFFQVKYHENHQHSYSTDALLATEGNGRSLLQKFCDTWKRLRADDSCRRVELYLVSNETNLWKAYQRRFGITKVSGAGVLKGIQDIESGRLFIVKPYSLLQCDKQTGQNPRFPLTGGDRHKIWPQFQSRPQSNWEHRFRRHRSRTSAVQYHPLQSFHSREEAILPGKCRSL